MTANGKTHRPPRARRRGRAPDGSAPHHRAAGGRCTEASWSARSTCTTCCAPAVDVTCRRSLRGTPRSRIRLLVLDVDGVLTDGRLYFGAARRGAQGLPRARRPRHRAAAARGHRGRRDLRPPLADGRARAAASSASATFTRAAQTSLPAFDAPAARACGSPGRSCACVGDDLPDLPLMRAVGARFAVADAHPRCAAPPRMSRPCPADAARCARSAICCSPCAPLAQVRARDTGCWASFRSGAARRGPLLSGGRRDERRTRRRVEEAMPEPGYSTCKDADIVRDRRRRPPAVHPGCRAASQQRPDRQQRTLHDVTVHHSATTRQSVDALPTAGLEPPEQRASSSSAGDVKSSGNRPAPSAGAL